LINAVGGLMLRRACLDAAQWPDDVRVAVNLSPLQFRVGNLLSVVMDALKTSGLSPKRLELEITETVLLDKSDQVLATLHALRALGVRISMDDFGTGYSSLSNLRAFPFDKIKIDGSFIKSVNTNEQAATIVRAVLGLGRGLGLPVLAEGVETPAEPTAAPAEPTAETPFEELPPAPPIAGPTAAAPEGTPAAEPAAPEATPTPTEPQAGAPVTPAAPEATPAPGEPVAAEPAEPAPAMTRIEKLKADAEAGDPRAQFELGLRYAEGEGVKKNNKEAAKWMMLAAEQGLPPAQYRMGVMYERGLGVPRDMKLAKTWYERAANAGNRKAMYNLAVLLADGSTGKPDYKNAAKWFLAAAELGLKDSQFNIAILYERGLGVEVNLIEAYKWYAAAAAQGDTDAAARALMKLMQ
jgi:hypothetical protein